MRRSESWGQFALLVLVAGYLLARPGMLAISGLMLVVLAVGWTWNRLALTKFAYRRRFRYRRSFPGEAVSLDLQVENRKRLPLAWLRTTDPWPLPVGPSDPEGLLPSHLPGEGLLGMLVVLRGRERLRRQVELLFRSRGVYRVGPATAESGDPFGLFRSQATVQAADHLVVFPEVRALGELGIAPDDPFGERKSVRPLFEDITRTVGVRDYRPGDAFHSVHWPATARSGHLQTRVHQPVSGLDLIVCLNAATYPRFWEGTDPDLLESLVSTAASLAQEAYSRGYRVGLISNGSLAHADRPFLLAPGRSRDHLAHILETLAALAPLITAPFERYLLAQAPRLEYGSTLFVVTAFVTPELAESLIRLKARSRRTALLSLDRRPPPSLPGVEILRLAGTGQGRPA
jgi:uncharacterized protein (DUF58 family)